jgi:formate dehydrogenase major subunit/formate dehydrogenase alpha subunit
VAGLAISFGSGAMSNSMDDIAEFARAILVIGSNTTEQHPVFGTMLRRAVRQRGVQLVVADPRKIDLVDCAALHLQQKPGTDIALINGLMNIILDKGWEDGKFIHDRTEGFEEFKATIRLYPPGRVADITGVPVDQLAQAAEILARQKPMAVIWAMGITQHTVGVHNVMNLANLQMLLGNMGIPGGGVNPLRGQNNVQGACDMGGLPNVYPAYQVVTNPESRKKFEAAWGVSLPDRIGMTATEMIPGVLQNKVHALYILGEDPAMSDPDSGHVRKCLEAVDFLVLQEIFPSETSQYADVLLPGVSFAEKEGTFTNTERRVQLVRKAIEPMGEARPDWRIVIDLAAHLLAEGERQPAGGTYSGWQYQTPGDIMTEINALTPSYAGITYARLGRGERLQWPVPDSAHPGTPILHSQKFARGVGKFAPLEDVPPAETPDNDYPMLLSTGRVLYHWHGGQMTRRSAGLVAVYDKALVEICPEDADRLGLDNRDRVRVTSRRGSLQAETWITDRVPPGMVYANFHFPESSANELTIAALDPVSKIPEYKVCAVKVESIQPPESR